MAKLVFAAGTSHTPLLTFGSALWHEYAKRDTSATKLNLSDGTYLTYDELLARVTGRYAAEATPEIFNAIETRCQAALDRIADELAQARPDIVVVITDDESELFSRGNTPAISLYYGETIVTRPLSSKMLDLADLPAFFMEIARRYAMDEARTYPAAPEFAWNMIESMINHHIDVGSAGQVEEPTRAGFGHGIGFVIQRLFAGKQIPVLPILLNTYYPPNAPLPARCVRIGEALRTAIEQYPKDIRVAFIASGGLSHFVVDEDLDKAIVAALRSGDARALGQLSPDSLNAGSSEIRNWIVMAGLLRGALPNWLEYEPIRRTPAGTGIGVAFGTWLLDG